MKLKKILSLLVAMTMLFSCIGITAMAEETASSLTFDEIENAYLITSVEDFIKFRDDVNKGVDYAGQTVKLSKSIDLSGEENWTPIGNGARSSKTYTGNSFKGVFDGGNYTISGLNITSSDGADTAIGLFGVVDGGAVKNLNLTDVDINVATSNLAGGAIGMMLNNATADNITVSGSVTGYDGVGGVVGRMIISGTISNCTNKASVTSPYGGIGGVVGKAYYEDSNSTSVFASISSCTNNGTITAPMYIGGIVGLARCNVTGCTNNGDVVGGTQTGGIIGQLIAAGTVSDNVNDAKIFGKNHMGGIIGDYTQSTAYTYYAVSITNNTNRGELAATEQCAAIMGCNNIDGFSGMTASGNVSYYNAEGLELFGNPEDMVIDDTNKFDEETVPVAYIGKQGYESVQAAIDAAKNGETIVLSKDCDETVSINKSNVAFTIDGGDFEYTGAIQINVGQNVIIKNINFVHTDDSARDFIANVGSPTGKNYNTTMTVENCTFTGNGKDSDVAIRTTHPTYITVNDCEGRGLHSFLQNTGGHGVEINGVTITDSKGGIAMGTVHPASVNNSNITTRTYGIRLDAGNNAVATLNSNTVEAYIPVSVRKVTETAGYGSLNFEGKSSYIASNADGVWCAICEEEFEEGVNLNEPGSDVVVNINDASISEDGLFGAYEEPVAGLSGSGTEKDPYKIGTKEELSFFASKVNDGTYKGVYAELTATIDLEQEDWTPIGTSANPFTGTFDGQGHTISNVWVIINGNAGLFGQVAEQSEKVTGTVQNLTVDNATIIANGENSAGVIAVARSGAQITNVKLTGEIAIQGYRGVGGIVGNGFPTINNCSVEGEGSITATYWGAGGILGFASDKGAKASNSTVTATETGLTIHGELGGVGAVTGTPHGAATNGAVISGAQITSNNNYCMGYVDASGTVSGTVTVTDVKVKVKGEEIIGCDAVASIGDKIYFDLQDAFDAVKDGETITLLQNVTVETPAYGENALNYAKAVNCTIDLDGYTVSADTGNSVFRFNINGTGATENITVTLKNGEVISGDNTWCAIMASGISADVKMILNLENVDVKNSKGYDFGVKSWENAVINAKNVNIEATKQAGGFYAIGGEIVLDNCNVTQKGLYSSPWTSMAFGVSSGGKLTVNSGEYSAKPTATEEGNGQGTTHGSWTGGVMSSGGTLIINGGTFTNGNFGDVAATAPRGVIVVDAGANLEINGGTFNGMAQIIDYTNNVGDASKNPIVAIKGGTYSANPESDWVKLPEGYAALPDLNGNYIVGEAPTAIVKNLGAMTIPANEHYVYNGSLTTGTVDMPLNFVMQFVADQDAEDMETSPYADWYADFVITFDGIKNGSFDSTGCYLAGYYGSTDSWDGLWVKIPVDALLKTIEEGVRYPVMMSVGMPQIYNYICSGVQAFSCAMFIPEEILAENPDLKVNLELNVVDSSDDDKAYAALQTGENIYKASETAYTAEDFKNYVAQIGDDKYTSLQTALDDAAAGTGNITVEILDDIDLKNVDWNPVTVSGPGYPVVTVNGNGKTITGLNDMLFAGTWAGKSGLIINDLTIKDSNIVKDKDDAKGTVGVGAFIGYPQASATITLNNCHLVDSKVEGGHWTGGLIGYAAGYAGNDGPVFMNLTITNCSVTDSTITGKGSVGGVIGHGSGNGWTNVVIENTDVFDNTITSTGSSSNKAGAIMGTIGAAGQPTTADGETKTGGAFVSATVSGNTVTSNGTTITTVYGRQGTSTGMLYVTGGNYDNYPIEENVSYAAPADGYEIIQNEDDTWGVTEKEDVELFDFDGTTVTLGNSLAINFYVRLADLDGEDYYAEIVPEKGDKVTIPYKKWGKRNENGVDTYRLVTYDGLAAKQMTDEFSVTIYNGEGNPVSETKLDSMRAYAERGFDSFANNPKLMTALIDMLNYGAAAQVKFNYKTENLANAGCEEYQQYASADKELTDERKVLFGENVFDGTTLSLENNIVLNAYFKNLTTDMYATVEYTTHSGIPKTINVNGNEFIKDTGSAGLHIIKVDTLAIADAEQLVTITVYNAAGDIYCQVVDSVTSYLCRAMNAWNDDIYKMTARFTYSAREALKKVD